MFHSVMCNDASQLPRLHLTAVVCYYGKHYSTFIFHTKLQEWVYFDDATVLQVSIDLYSASACISPKLKLQLNVRFTLQIYAIKAVDFEMQKYSGFIFLHFFNFSNSINFHLSNINMNLGLLSHQ